MKNKIILNIVLVYFVVVGIVLVSQLCFKGNGTDVPITETVKLVDRLNNAVVLYNESPVMLVNKRQSLVNNNNFNIMPKIVDDCFYVPLSFFEQAYGAVVEDDFNKKQASIRFNNTAIVFKQNDLTAKIISNSNENTVTLDSPMVYFNAFAYVPLDVVCQVYNKEIFIYNDSMAIISDTEENVTFDPSVEEELLQNIEHQVKNLPLVLSEDNLKRLIGAKSNIFGLQTEKGEVSEASEKYNHISLLNNSQSDRLAVVGDYLYTLPVAGNKLAIVNSNDVNSEQIFFDLPDGLVGDTIYSYEDYLYVMGKGENISVSYNKDNSETSEPVLKNVAGKKTFIFCFDTAENKNAPVLKKFFYTDGEIVAKKTYSNSLCVAVKEDAFLITDDEEFYPPSYFDIDKKYQSSFEDVKYMPEMADTCYTSVFRFDMADVEKTVDADFFLGVGNAVELSQNAIYFTAKSTIPTDDKKSMIEGTNIYKLNLNNGGFARTNIDGKLIKLVRTDDFSDYIAVIRQNKENSLYVINDALEIDSIIDKLSLKDIIGVECAENKVYLTDKDKNDLLVVELSQIYSENNTDEPETVLQPKETGVYNLSGIDYIRPFETSVIGLGKAENSGAEIAMWSLKDNAIKTNADVIGEVGSTISPVRAGNIVKNEIVFNIRLFVNEEDIPVEKYNGLYIYNVNENTAPMLKGRITHNVPEQSNVSITDVVYLNKKYFTLSDNMLAIDSDDIEIKRIAEINFN